MTKWLRDSLDDAVRRTALLPRWAIALDYAMERGTSKGATAFALELVVDPSWSTPNEVDF